MKGQSLQEIQICLTRCTMKQCGAISWVEKCPWNRRDGAETQTIHGNLVKIEKGIANQMTFDSYSVGNGAAIWKTKQ